jgi:multimeric flavodoxin WrbA
MAAKIMVLTSSPNKGGNTNTLAGWVVEGARKAGATVERFDVAHLKYKAVGCTACMACQGSEEYACVIPDEASAVVKRMPEFDTIVFATPIYFFGPNAQAKALIDRMFCLIKFNKVTGEYTFARSGGAMGLVATAGGGMEDSGLRIAEQMFRMIAEFGGAKLHTLLVPEAPADAAGMAEDGMLKRRAVAFGEELAKA